MILSEYFAVGPYRVTAFRLSNQHITHACMRMLQPTTYIVNTIRVGFSFGKGDITYTVLVVAVSCCCRKLESEKTIERTKSASRSNYEYHSAKDLSMNSHSGHIALIY
jgi:hypothetical protein